MLRPFGGGEGRICFFVEGGMKVRIRIQMSGDSDVRFVLFVLGCVVPGGIKTVFGILIPLNLEVVGGDL